MRFWVGVVGAAAMLLIPGAALAVSPALSIQANEAYLAANAHKPGVQVMRDGLQYRVIKPGFGLSPKDGGACSSRAMSEIRSYVKTPCRPPSMRSGRSTCW